MSYSTLYLIFGFGYVMICNGYFHNVQHNLVDELLTGYNRMKRSDQNNTGKGKDECAGSCAETIITKMNTTSPDLKEAFEKMQKSPDMTMTFTKPQFQKLCKDIIAPALTCIEKCPKTTLTKIIDKAFAPVSFICVKHYDEIYKNYDCLQKVHNATLEPCVHGQCKQYSNATKSLMDQSEHLLANNQTSQWKKLMSENCQYTSCMTTCCSPIMEKTCGKNVTDLMTTKVEQYSLRNAKEMISLLGHQNDFPPECEKILNETKGNRTETTGKPTPRA